MRTMGQEPNPCNRLVETAEPCECLLTAAEAEDKCPKERDKTDLTAPLDQIGLPGQGGQFLRRNATGQLLPNSDRLSAGRCNSLHSENMYLKRITSVALLQWFSMVISQVLTEHG